MALQVEVVFGQLLVQAALFEEVVDDATLGQVGLGNFDRCFCIVRIFCDEVFIFVYIFIWFFIFFFWFKWFLRFAAAQEELQRKFRDRGFDRGSNRSL